MKDSADLLYFVAIPRKCFILPNMRSIALRSLLYAKAEISQPVIENQAAYLDSWSQALKKDSKLFVTAAGKAQKAADHILGVSASNEGEPAGDMCA